MGFHEGAYATVWEITNQGDNFPKFASPSVER